MQQDPDQAGKDDDKFSTGGMSSQASNVPVETGTLEGTIEPSEDETSTMEPP